MIFDTDISVALKVRSLGCHKGEDWLFRGLSFDIRPGQLVWLRGQNGSGKTSLLRMVVGLAQPDEGSVEFVLPAQHTHAKPVVYMGHSNALKDDLTALESLQFLLELQGRATSSAAIAGAMGKFAVHQRRNQFVKTLSQGQRRRVALSRLVLEKDTSLWVLDEPFEALDRQGIDVLNSLISEHVVRGGSVLMTSHISVASDTTPVETLELDALVAS